MKVAGFTIIRNAVLLDYPVVESIMSALPLCDVFYVGVGNCSDGTIELIRSVRSPKIRIIESEWDNTLRRGGAVLASETNKVLESIPSGFDWCLYVQADEQIHEDDHNRIRSAMNLYRDDSTVEGLLFNFRHFFGSYSHVGAGNRWYRREVRIIRNDPRIRSYGDAQGFRKKGSQRLNVKDCGAFIYHYGWARSPVMQQRRQREFHRFWHNDEWIDRNFPADEAFEYENADLIETFDGTHPEVMRDRIQAMDWQYLSLQRKKDVRYRLLHFIEKLTGVRLHEYRNFRIG